MDVQSLRGRAHIALVLEPGRQRRGQPRAGRRTQLVQRGEAPRGQVRRDGRVGRQQQLGRPVLRTLQAGGAELQRRERAPGRLAGPLELEGGAERGAPPGQRADEHLVEAGRLGIAEERDQRVLPRCDERIRRQPSGHALAALGGPRQRGDLRRRTPVRPARQRHDLLRPRRRRRQQPLEQRATARLALAGAARLLLRVALRRGRGQLVDIGEQRLGGPVHRGRRQTGVLASFDQPAPGHPRPEAIGGQERLEAAALAQLAGTERHVHRPTRKLGPRPRGHQLDETGQRLLDAGADVAAVAAAQLAAVGRDPLPDRGHDLVGQAGQRGPQRIREVRREILPRCLGGAFVVIAQNSASKSCICAADRTDHGI